MENQITEQIAHNLKCRYIVEGANGPTTKEADRVIDQKGIILVPDIFANSGGVIVSYFEWVQNIQTLTWERDQVNDMLEQIMTTAFNEILAETQRSQCTLRMGAYIVAIRRLLYAEQIKGIFP